MPPESSNGSNTSPPTLTPPPPHRTLPQHGIKGAYYGGHFVDIEDCVNTFNPKPGTASSDTCTSCPNSTTCPRSKSRNDASKDKSGTKYDVVIIGAGCIGGAIARELSRYSLSVLLVEAADDVSQGATKGNSGIVHAGYDDKPGTNRAKFCWTGNQMFPQLDKELRFGYQLNGSLVLALNDKEIEVLKELKKRGETNGVQNLEIIDKTKLHELEPGVTPKAIGALRSPDAGNVIPYEFTIALCENAVDNGVELRIRREVVNIVKPTTKGGESENENFKITLRHWEPKPYVDYVANTKKSMFLLTTGGIVGMALVGVGTFLSLVETDQAMPAIMTAIALIGAGITASYSYYITGTQYQKTISNKTPIKDLVEQCPKPEGEGGTKVSVKDMFTGGSGSWNAVKGITVALEEIEAKYVVNCAGGASDVMARMIGDESFTIKPRLGDYLLLKREQGYLAHHTLFPCPDPILGKGVLVQTTLWGNLILGPTARDTYKPDKANMSNTSVQEYILSKCRELVPYFDPKETFHAFCGARAKNSRNDWIIESSTKHQRFVHAAGIDSPGLAGSPAIAMEVVKLLRDAGLQTKPNLKFNPNRAPIITPKVGMRGLKMGPIGKNDSSPDGSTDNEKQMSSNVICKCEKVTEMEVVRAMKRSLPIDSTQAIRKRTRAGMGHCQGDPDNYNCECRVKAIIARENGVPVEEVGGRPWPATSTLSERWIEEEEKEELVKRMMKK